MLPELCKRQSVEHILQVKSCIAQLGAASYMFSEVKMLLTLFYVIPGSSATAERSFSALRLIKNYFENDNDIAATRLANSGFGHSGTRADPGLVNGGPTSPQAPRGGFWGGGVPLPNGGGGCAPSPEFFLNFYPKMAHFCAFCNLQQ